MEKGVGSQAREREVEQISIQAVVVIAVGEKVMHKQLTKMNEAAKIVNQKYNE